MDPHGSPSNAAAACSFPSACRAAARRGVVVKNVGFGTLGKGKPWENRGKTLGVVISPILKIGWRNLELNFASDFL